MAKHLYKGPRVKEIRYAGVNSRRGHCGYCNAELTRASNFSSFHESPRAKAAQYECIYRSQKP